VNDRGEKGVPDGTPFLNGRIPEIEDPRQPVLASNLSLRPGICRGVGIRPIIITPILVLMGDGDIGFR